MLQQRVVLCLVQEIVTAELFGDFSDIIQLMHRDFADAIRVDADTRLKDDPVLVPNVHNCLLFRNHFFIIRQIFGYQLLFASFISEYADSLTFGLDHRLDFDPLQPIHQLIFAVFPFVIVVWTRQILVSGLQRVLDCPPEFSAIQVQKVLLAVGI